MTSNKTFIVVAYDIPDDRRRSRLCRKLKSFGRHVQYSVFECLLDAQGLQHLEETVRTIIKPREDHVRYYRLCEACQQKIKVIGGTITHEVKTIIV
jgi:CRISPR-associated protein Cas2